MVKVALPYLILLIGWFLFLAGGLAAPDPFFGMFAGLADGLGALIIVAFFIAVVPSLDDFPAGDARKAAGTALILAGSVALGVVAYLFGAHAVTLHGALPDVTWLVAWLAASALLGLGAWLKSGWTYRRIVPMMLLFAALSVAIRS